MQYNLDIEIDLPLSRVIELYEDPENLKHWQPGLVSFEHLSGEPGEPGATSKILYKMGKKDVEMIETIISNNLPEDFTATYEAKGVWNLIKNKFIEINNSKTKWLFETEIKCSGFIKVIAFLMPGMFKKESIKFMKQFKEFAENA